MAAHTQRVPRQTALSCMIGNASEEADGLQTFDNGREPVRSFRVTAWVWPARRPITMKWRRLLESQVAAAARMWWLLPGMTMTFFHNAV
jgi:hypothetical protein